ncbi:lysozyme [Actinosynnema sp. NPDC020468]|uniref:lysozyme n=1 Tax=Actinosynnema sp. NPDC020468 TaxID=3154488 RepID=UPI0033CF9169
MGSQIAKHEGRADRGVAPAAAGTTDGVDVSSHQGDVDWQAQWNAGKRFAYVKATEGTSYRNPYFAQQYNGSYRVGLIRGAYHFALPDKSSGAAQAVHFLAAGGGWSRDGRTLPGALDVEYNPYGPTCYGLDKAAMAAWVKDFGDTYHARTGRWPLVYTSTSWWNQCAGGDFTATTPLWVARYATAVGALPHPWSVHTIWQHSSTPIDQDRFNGGLDRVRALALG